MSISSANETTDLFDWAEPLLIEAIGECYEGMPEWRLAARLHARALRALVGEDSRRAASCRLELIAQCAARRISIGTIQAADRTAFREVTRMIMIRYRNSPRLRLHHIRRLRAALDKLPIGRSMSVSPRAPSCGSSGSPRLEARLLG